MENLALVSSSSPKFLLTSCPNLCGPISIRRSLFALPQRKKRDGRTTLVSAAMSKGTGERSFSLRTISTNGMEVFASISSSSGTETSSIGVNPGISVPPPSSQIGSPLFWIGVGVGLSALFSWVASNLKKYAMQQAFKTMMGQMSSGSNDQFSNSVFSPGSPLPFPTSNTSTATTSSPFSFPPSSTSTSPSAVASQPSVTDVTATNVEAAPTKTNPNTKVKDEPKKYAFVDVSPEETFEKGPFESFVESTATSSSKEADVVPQNGAATKQDNNAYNQQSAYQQSQDQSKRGSRISVEALEKMLEDPTVQKMIYPHLPEEMRNPATFKWMLQNPEYRQQLQDMISTMGGSDDWDAKLMESLKNFDLSSPEVKQQFDQIGFTPEEVISKIMANPEVALSFQNPRIQTAIMDCSQNPMSIMKYQNDKEVMNVFNKIQELFPGMTG